MPALKGDHVELFQRISRTELEIRKRGSSPLRGMRLAWLRLAIGDPDAALDAVVKHIGTAQDDLLVRDVLWVSALALALKVAISRQEAEGAPNVVVPPKTDIPALRRKAINLLQRIPERDAEESHLLRVLMSDGKLDFVEDLATVSR